MSDLISRSKLLKEVESWGGCVEALQEYISNMPTAYNLDAVVGELEKMASEDGRMAYCQSQSYCGDKNCFDCLVQRSIEIVKGGINGTQ